MIRFFFLKNLVVLDDDTKKLIALCLIRDRRGDACVKIFTDNDSDAAYRINYE